MRIIYQVGYAGIMFVYRVLLIFFVHLVLLFKIGIGNAVMLECWNGNGGYGMRESKNGGRIGIILSITRIDQSVSGPYLQLWGLTDPSFSLQYRSIHPSVGR